MATNEKASYEPPQVEDLGTLEDLTAKATGIKEAGTMS